MSVAFKFTKNKQKGLFREHSLHIGEGAGGKLGGPGKIALYKGVLELFLIFQGGGGGGAL